MRKRINKLRNRCRIIEKWIPIIGYDGLYEISSKGRVMSHKTRRSKVLKNNINNGYARVQLTRGNVKCFFAVHRLVADAFVSNPHNKPHVNHIDGDRENNLPHNLEWVTPKENLHHAIASGLNCSYKKLVLNTKNGIYYDSIRKAEVSMGLTRGHLTGKLNGYKHNNTPFVFA